MNLTELSLTLGMFLLGLLVSYLISVADSVYEKGHNLMLASSIFKLSCRKPPNRLWDLRASANRLLRLFIVLVTLSFVYIVSIPILIYFLPINRVINQAFIFLCLISSGFMIAPIYHRMIQTSIGVHIPEYLSEEDIKKLSQSGVFFDVSCYINELETFIGFMQHVIYVYFIVFHLMIYFIFSMLFSENLQFIQILPLSSILLTFYVIRWLIRKSFQKRITTPYAYAGSRHLLTFLSAPYWLSILLTIFNIFLMHNLFNIASTILFVYCYVIVDLSDGYFRSLVVFGSDILHASIHRLFQKLWIKLLLFTIALLLLKAIQLLAQFD